MKFKIAPIVALLSIFHSILFCQEKNCFNKYFNNNIYFEYATNHCSHNLAFATWGNSYRTSIEFKNGFLIKELSTKTIQFSAVKKGNLAFAEISHTGGAKMGDLTTDVGYGKNFGQRFAFAMRFYYFFTHAQGYEARHSFTFDLSFAAKITSQWSLGVSVYNPAHLKFGVVGNEYIPLRFNFDIAYSLSEKVLLAMGIEKEIAGAFRINMGGCFALNKYLMLDFQCAIPEPAIQLAVQLMWRSLRIRFASEYQFSLGLSPLCGISYEF